MKNDDKEEQISIQPYFVMDGDDFCQRIYVKNGISHFFSFSNKSEEDFTIPLLVDSCCNLIFEYKNGTLRTHFIGITVETRTFSVKSNAEYFGVRLQPGALKFISEYEAKDLLGKIIILDELSSTKELCKKMAKQKDFESRIQTFIDEYESYGKVAVEDKQKNLFKQISDLIVQRKGKVKICELEKLSGYTSRYINKIFDKEIGVNPKQLCNSVKFQFMLHDLNRKNSEKLTGFATDYDFYDQAHFINEFKEFAGKTPKEYKREVQICQYCENVRNA